MRYIHPAAWAGLLLNALLMFGLIASVNSIPASELTDVDPRVFEVLRALQPVMFVLLSLQALAVGLIASKNRAGLVLAAVASFFMMPAGLVYLTGCVLSHYRWKYAAFAPYTGTYDQAEAVFPSAVAPMLLSFAGGGLVLCALCFSMGMANLGAILLGLGLTGAYLGMRAKKHPALSLHQRYFTVVPGIFADSLAIPYDIVRAATLYDDESIRFAVEPQPGQELTLVWSLLRVEKKSRRAALERLGSVLSAHQVPLY